MDIELTNRLGKLECHELCIILDFMQSKAADGMKLVNCDGYVVNESVDATSKALIKVNAF